MPAASRLALLGLLVACGETGLHGEHGVDRPGEHGDGDGEGGTDGRLDPDLGVCDHEPAPAFEAPFADGCLRPGEPGTFEPLVQWARVAWTTAPGSNWVMAPPLVLPLLDTDHDGDADPDDVPAIVVVSFMGEGVHLRAVRGDDGAEVWSTPAPLQITGGPAAGDLDHDGRMEIVAPTLDAGLAAFEDDGRLAWHRPGVLEGHVDGTSDNVSLADLDGDGHVEIVVGRAILDARGHLLGAGSLGRGGVADFGNVGTASVVADLDLDGTAEVIVGNAAYARDGQPVWQRPGLPDGYPAVGDFDGDGLGEVVVVGGGRVRLMDHEGRVRWDRALPHTSDPRYGGPPTLADFDGDGHPEIGVASGETYAVLEADGTVLWTHETRDRSSGNTGSTVFDFEGDGIAEVVYADETTLWVLDGRDGTVQLAWDAHSNGTWLEYPVVADVDADEQAEIVVVHTPQNGLRTGLTVLEDATGSWRPATSIWNQHAYSITNVHDDGRIPARPAPSWHAHNTFRSSDRVPLDGVRAPDLRLVEGAICEEACDEGKLVVDVHVGNAGVVDVDEAVVQVLAHAADGAHGVHEVVVHEVEAGWFHEARPLVLEGPDWRRVEALELRVHGTAEECDEGNNILVVHGPFCAD